MSCSGDRRAGLRRRHQSRPGRIPDELLESPQRRRRPTPGRITTTGCCSPMAWANLGPEMPSKARSAGLPISNDARSNHALLRRIAGRQRRSILQPATRPTSRSPTRSATNRSAARRRFQGRARSPTSTRAAADASPAASRISGRLLVPEAKVTLKYGVRRRRHATRVEFTLKQAGATETGLVVAVLGAAEGGGPVAPTSERNSDDAGGGGEGIQPGDAEHVADRAGDGRAVSGVQDRPAEELQGGVRAVHGRIEQQKAQVAQTQGAADRSRCWRCGKRG